MTLRPPTLRTSTQTSTSLMTRLRPMRPPSTPTACSTTLQTMPLSQQRLARHPLGMVTVKVHRPGAWSSLCPPRGPPWQTWKTQRTAVAPCSCPLTPLRAGAPQPQRRCQGMAATAAVPSIPWCRGCPARGPEGQGAPVCCQENFDPHGDLKGSCESLDPAALPHTPRRCAHACRDCTNLLRERATAPSLLRASKTCIALGHFFFLNGRRITKIVQTTHFRSREQSRHWGPGWGPNHP